MTMRRPAHGFTLLEIAVAIGIVGVLAVVSYGVFARVLSAKQTVEARGDEAAMARTTIARIVRDLRAATVRPPSRGPLPGAPAPGKAAPGTPGTGVPPPVPAAGTTATPGFVSVDHTEAQIPFDEIAFTAVVRRPLSLAATASDLASVHYFLRAEDGRPGRFILYRESVSSLSGEKIDLDSPDPNATSAIIGGVAGLRFRFFDGEEWVEEWSSTAGQHAGKVPLGVEMILALEGSDGVVETYHTAVDLPAAMATGATALAGAGKAGSVSSGDGDGSGGGKKGKKKDKDDDDDDDAPTTASDDDDDE
jgi:prepilin-type N-terminal cleavage/methylation domain-containing protein